MFIIPDVYIRKEDSACILEMNARLQNKLSMNTENYELYKSAACNKEAKAFLKEKLNDFKWLQYSISRRAVTLKKI
ncbi:RNA polymerase sigma-54 factor, partial [Erysipelatoclostridium ramosum]|nr:RNA polymerase sigma-54 factor [Thomasclavelia ramosa]